MSLRFILQAEAGELQPLRVVLHKEPDADGEVVSGEGKVEVRKSEVRKMPAVRPEKVAAKSNTGALQNDVQALQVEWITGVMTADRAR